MKDNEKNSNASTLTKNLKIANRKSLNSNQNSKSENNLKDNSSSNPKRNTSQNSNKIKNSIHHKQNSKLVKECFPVEEDEECYDEIAEQAESNDKADEEEENEENESGNQNDEIDEGALNESENDNECVDDFCHDTGRDHEQEDIIEENEQRNDFSLPNKVNNRKLDHNKTKDYKKIGNTSTLESSEKTKTQQNGQKNSNSSKSTTRNYQDITQKRSIANTNFCKTNPLKSKISQESNTENKTSNRNRLARKRGIHFSLKFELQLD